MTTMTTAGAAGATPDQMTAPAVEIVLPEALHRGTVEWVRDRLHEALSLQPAVLAVDMTSCAWVDAAGMAMLVSVHCRAFRQDCRFLLRNVPRRAYRLIKVAGLARVFEVASLVDNGEEGPIGSAGRFTGEGVVVTP